MTRVSRLSLLAAFVVLVFLYFAYSPPLFLGASKAQSDKTFGPLNACVSKVMREGRKGFAVAPKATSLAVFNAQTVAWCHEATSTADVLAFPKVVALAIDGHQQLWLSTEYEEKQETRLWKKTKTDVAPVPVSPVPVTQMFPHPQGVVALDENGLVTSFSFEGRLLGQAQVAGTWPTPAQLLVNGNGTWVAVVVRGSVLVFALPQITPHGAYKPCQVTTAAWTKDLTRLRTECQQPGQAFEFAMNSSKFEPVSKGDALPTFLVLGTHTYVQACEGLPCTASSSTP